MPCGCNLKSKEGIRYYVAGLIWLKILQLKRKTAQKMTKTENQILNLNASTTCTVPEPIMTYLQAFGAIKSASFGDFIPEFPKLPTIQIKGFGGYFAPLNTETHILYEEFPSLGVAAEGLRMALRNTGP